MPLNNIEVEIKIKWIKYCVLSACGNDSTDGEPDNFIFEYKGYRFICFYFFNERQQKTFKTP